MVIMLILVVSDISTVTLQEDSSKGTSTCFFLGCIWREDLIALQKHYMTISTPENRDSLYHNPNILQRHKQDILR